MNIKKTFYAALLLMGCMTATAQENTTTEYVFNPHWYLQLQGGGQETLGEISFGDLLSPNVQLGVGYQFNPVVGTRLTFNAWQSKAGTKLMKTGNTYKWKWNYVSPMVDVTFDLCNLFGGFNPKRVVSVGLFGGIGANIGFNNDEEEPVARQQMIAAYKTANFNPEGEDYFNLYHWDGSKARFTGRFGGTLDFRVSDAISLGLELSANVLNDHYNSKKAKNPDWYFNGLVGLKWNLGKTYTTRVVEKHVCPKVEPQVVEKVVEKVIEKPAPVPAVEPLRRDIFFVIRGTKISDDEMLKVREIAQYLYQHPEATVTITGYADKNTGNAKINRDLSIKRAQVVADTLKKQFGIVAGRITTDYKGDTEQPYDTPEKNRVSICISK
jgi:outer membrane protein OmpA-like peptidoglycan-associated protein